MTVPLLFNPTTTYSNPLTVIKANKNKANPKPTAKVDSFERLPVITTYLRSGSGTHPPTDELEKLTSSAQIKEVNAELFAKLGILLAWFKTSKEVSAFIAKAMKQNTPKAQNPQNILWHRIIDFAKNGNPKEIEYTKALQAIQLRNQIITNNKGLVINYLKLSNQDKRGRFGELKHTTYDSLGQSGMVGLSEAVQMFDPTKGAAFSTYAMFHIKNRVLEALNYENFLIPVTHTVTDKMNSFRKVQASLKARLGKEATTEELAQEMGKTPKQIEDLLALQQLRQVQAQFKSLDAPVNNDSCPDGMAVLLDILSLTPFETGAVQDEQLVELIAALEQLSAMQQAVLKGVLTGQKNKKIAELLKVTPITIGRHKEKGIQAVKVILGIG